MRSLEVCGSSVDKIKNFEYNCLGEVRILGALKHPCIVEMYGHQISTKWIHSVDGSPENRILQSAIFMEYIKGGSLKVIFLSGLYYLVICFSHSGWYLNVYPIFDVTEIFREAI